jgi:dihydrofolate reductase
VARKIVGAAFVSLDGVMQAPGGPPEDPSGGFEFGGWLPPVGDEGVFEQVGKLFDQPFDLLLGRRTYDIFSGYWPFQSPEDPIAAAFAECGKYVLTHSGEPLEWQGSHRVADMAALAEVKAQDGRDLVIQGSSTIYPQLLAHGLLDRLTLLIFPLVLGSGKRLFGDGTPPGTLRLVEHKLTPRGTMIATYEPAGPVRTGTFMDDNPSEQELARRAKIEEGTW